MTTRQYKLLNGLAIRVAIFYLDGLEYHRNCRVVLGTVLLQQQWNRHIVCGLMYDLSALLRIKHPHALLEIWHFAIVLCNWFSVACDTCNWKFTQLPKTSCMKFGVACDNRIIQVHTVGLYSFIHPYSILAVGRATACNYRGCVHTALHVN